MENDVRFTNKLDEKIYVCLKDNEEENEKNISAFFTELVNRKRYDALEGGLQACAVFFEDKGAMKICENDGRAPHMNSFINLIKHLNNDNNYLSLKGTGFFILSQQERKQLIESGIEIRILDGANKLMLTINSSIKDVSSFQIDAVNKVICACKTLKDSNIYNTVEI